MLSVKQGDIKYHFWVFGMTRPRIEPRSPGPLANTLLIRPNQLSKNAELMGTSVAKVKIKTKLGAVCARAWVCVCVCLFVCG